MWLHDCLTRAARIWPASPGTHDGDRTRTSRGIVHEPARLTGGLYALGLTPGESIALPDCYRAALRGSYERGDNVMSGCRNQSELSTATLQYARQGWLSNGETGHLDQDGYCDPAAPHAISEAIIHSPDTTWGCPKFLTWATKPPRVAVPVTETRNGASGLSPA
jgi:hypothetical protein